MRLAAQIEYLNYWTTGYGTSARDLHADGMQRTADWCLGGNQQCGILTDCHLGHSIVGWYCIYIHECM
ncbi:hypothetical protein BPA30113_01942 [Burkholderia paludis]|uniref:Uncharacterized protein n=1 Tax=Burkholderia paludis TaxID=1506587 RepID=A0A6P2JPH8_9BURK|nr:hypothetical protein LMG30113_06724 [Burkholderia paludis]VWB45858.1 hypothetical protein BPA30113_01942 [Burkholderia paludis]